MSLTSAIHSKNNQVDIQESKSKVERRLKNDQNLKLLSAPQGYEFSLSESNINQQLILKPTPIPVSLTPPSSFANHSALASSWNEKESQSVFAHSSEQKQNDRKFFLDGNNTALENFSSNRISGSSQIQIKYPEGSSSNRSSESSVIQIKDPEDSFSESKSNHNDSVPNPYIRDKNNRVIQDPPSMDELIDEEGDDKQIRFNGRKQFVPRAWKHSYGSMGIFNKGVRKFINLFRNSDNPLKTGDELIKHDFAKRLDIHSDRDVGLAFVNLSQARKDMSKVTLVWNTALLGTYIGLSVATGGLGLLSAPLFAAVGLGVPWIAKSIVKPIMNWLITPKNPNGVGQFFAGVGKNQFGDPGPLAHAVISPGKKLEVALNKNPNGLVNEQESIDKYICQTAMTALTIAANDDVSKNRPWFKKPVNGLHYLSRAKQNNMIKEHITEDGPFTFKNGNLTLKKNKYGETTEKTRKDARTKTTDILNSMNSRTAVIKSKAKATQTLQNTVAHGHFYAKLAGTALGGAKILAKPLVWVSAALGITESANELTKFGTRVEGFRAQSLAIIDKLNTLEARQLQGANNNNNKSIVDFKNAIKNLTY